MIHVKIMFCLRSLTTLERVTCGRPNNVNRTSYVRFLNWLISCIAGVWLWYALFGTWWTKFNNPFWRQFKNISASPWTIAALHVTGTARVIISINLALESFALVSQRWYDRSYVKMGLLYANGFLLLFGCNFAYAIIALYKGNLMRKSISLHRISYTSHLVSIAAIVLAVEKIVDGMIKASHEIMLSKKKE